MISRRVLLTSCATTGVILSTAPSLLARLAFAGSRPGELRMLAARDAAFLSQLADVVLPETDTPSASMVGVVDFIDYLLDRWYSSEEVLSYLRGLKACMDAQQGIDFETYIVELDDRSLGSPTDNSAELDFYRITKQLILIAYFTSKEGMEKGLQIDGPIGTLTFDSSGAPGGPIRY